MQNDSVAGLIHLVETVGDISRYAVNMLTVNPMKENICIKIKKLGKVLRLFEICGRPGVCCEPCVIWKDTNILFNVNLIMFVCCAFLV